MDTFRDDEMQTSFLEVITVVGFGIEAFGILVIIIGSGISTTTFVRTYRSVEEGVAYKKYRKGLGRSIILGLEFLIAGDIIRTVVVADSLENVGILALIILIRSFLSLTLHLEAEGRWPWQKDSAP
ncbi:DUF1622 domain-containing protein [Marinobacter sp. M216]|uniref:DUF1622 domain-containing protein n=1 Tax=Marinobacter albus TaxID=3030833 RepID=A0ABT7HAE1_9GAMM|nr:MULTISPECIES: DUF1622 domain-containing protein [unclassified Marinobacter]MBW7470818.1 DUF1622 domain-containing protein [Marinobacter sp. F4218]MDK9556912.1 DUF1622 domain-containing protein [Marinobacter sp. M216]